MPKQLILGAVFGLFVTTGPLSAQPSPPFVPVRATAEEQSAASAWLAANARAIGSLSPDKTDLAPIVERLTGAKIIGIGEATHGSHEDQAFKAELIRALIRAGAVRQVMIEGNIAPNAALDRYVRLGEGDPAVALGHPSQFRNLKGDEFGSLLVWLRAWNLTHPDDMVGIGGFDVQDAGRDADYALAYVAQRDPGFAAAIGLAFAPLRPAEAGTEYPRFPTTFDAMTVDERKAVSAAAVKLRDWFDAHEPIDAVDRDFEEARDSALAAVQGMVVFEYGIQPPEGMDPMDYYARRDRLMANNIIRLQQRHGKGTVLWAHDMHVLDRVTPPLRAMGLATLGTLIEDQLGADYRTVGFLWSYGAIRATAAAAGQPMNEIKPADTDITLRSDAAGTLGRLFEDALPGVEAAWIDMDAMRADPALAAFRKASYLPPYAGWFVVPSEWMRDYDQQALPWTDAFDIVVWHREITPQHRWPALP